MAWDAIGERFEMIRNLLAAAGVSAFPSTTLLRGALAYNYTSGNFTILLNDMSNLQLGDLVFICVSMSGGGTLSCSTSGWTDHGATNYQGRFFSKIMATGDGSITFTGASQKCTVVVAAVIPKYGITLGPVVTGTSPATLNPSVLSLYAGASGISPYASMVWVNCAGVADITGSSDYVRVLLAKAATYPTIALFFRDQVADGNTKACEITFTGTALQATARQIGTQTY